MPAPQHSVTAAIRVISSTDPAWDHDRINREYAELEKTGRGFLHPYMQYVIGRTRFDLDAPVQFGEMIATPRSYLLPESRPLSWLMRRLKIVELARCEDIGGNEGKLHAFRLSLLAIENGPTDLKLPDPGSQPLREAVCDSIVEVLGATAVFAAGAAAMAASAAPTSAEKKL